MSKGQVFIDPRAIIHENVIIYENSRIDGPSEIFENVTIFPNSYISNSKVGKGTKIYSARLENARIGTCSSVGNGAVIKSGCQLGDFVKVGANSVLKGSDVGSHTSIGSLCCVLGAKIQKYCNIGDGVTISSKQKGVVIGDGAKLGSAVTIVGSSVIERNKTIPSGSIIGED